MSAEAFTLIGILINTIGIVVVAVTNYLSNRNIESKVEDVRHATNSMKDALIGGSQRR